MHGHLFLLQDVQYRGKGITDGTFRGHRYFECADKAGMFISLDQVYQQQPGGAVASESSCAEKGGSKNSDRLSTDGDAREYNSSDAEYNSSDAMVSQSEPKRLGGQSDFKLGQRVKFLDKRDTERYGVIRWTGRNERYEITVVGIECVS